MSQESDKPGGDRGDEYQGSFPAQPAPTGELLRQAIQTIMPGASWRTAPAALDYRASRHTIRDWCRGKRGTPQWALDLMAAKLEARAAKPLALGATLRTAKPSVGMGWNKNGLKAWQAKQKAGG